MSFSLKLKSVVFLIKLDEQKISSASLQFNNELALFLQRRIPGSLLTSKIEGFAAIVSRFH